MIREAKKALLDGRFEDSFRICLEIKEREKAYEPELLFIGACSLFGLGHVHQAESWVNDFELASPGNVRALYLQAYVHLHARRYDQALLAWTRILRIDPSQTLADSLIEKLKEGERYVQREIQDPASFVKYVPLFFREEEKTVRPSLLSGILNGPVRYIVYSLGALLLTGAIALGIYKFVPFKNDPYEKIYESLPVAPSTGTVIPAKEFKTDKPRFYFEDRRAALDTYNEAREKVKRGQVNQARFLLGKIEMSNAGFEIKERTELLRESIPYVERNVFRDPLTVEAVLDEPYLLRGCQVLWKGRASSIQTTPRGQGFVLNMDDSPGKTVYVEAPASASGGPAREGEIVEVFGVFLEIKNDRIFIKALSLLL